jgi:hypothetical protein
MTRHINILTTHDRSRIAEENDILLIDDDDGALDSVSSLTYSSPQVNMALHSEEEQMQILHPLVFHFPDLHTIYQTARSLIQLVFPFNDKVYKDSYDTRQVPNCRRK